MTPLRLQPRRISWLCNTCLTQTHRPPLLGCRRMRSCISRHRLPCSHCPPGPRRVGSCISCHRLRRHHTCDRNSHRQPLEAAEVAKPFPQQPLEARGGDHAAARGGDHAAARGGDHAAARGGGGRGAAPAPTGSAAFIEGGGRGAVPSTRSRGRIRSRCW